MPFLYISPTCKRRQGNPIRIEKMKNFPIALQLKHSDCGITIDSHFLSSKEATQLYEWANKELQFEKLHIKIYGKEHIPERRTLSFGKEGLSYTYSNTTTIAKEFPRELLSIVDRLGELHPEGRKPNFVLCNYYPSGSAYISWHSDDEKDLCKGEPIFSVSVGAEREFLIREKSKDPRVRKDSLSKIPLKHGSLCKMCGNFQSKYEHSIPARKKVIGDRINFTFRYMKEKE